MTYQSRHITIKDPQSGYNAVADQYGTYHDHLNDFDKGFFVRLLPRETKDLDVVDLGAGDGRTHKQISNVAFKSYTACDIAEKLLKQHPSKNVKKVVCDLESPLPFPDASFDIAFSFFVLEHVENLDPFFEEVYRILKPGGLWIIGYFLQRREFVWKTGKDEFKIQLFNYRIQDIEKKLQQAFFAVKLHPIHEKGYLVGRDLECRK